MILKTLAIEEGKLNNTKWLNLEKLDSTKKLKEDLPRFNKVLQFRCCI